MSIEAIGARIQSCGLLSRVGWQCLGIEYLCKLFQHHHIAVGNVNKVVHDAGYQTLHMEHVYVLVKA